VGIETRGAPEPHHPAHGELTGAMRARGVRALLLTLAACASLVAQARIGNTWQDEVRIYTADIATQCASVQDQLKDFNVRKDPLTGYTLKDAVQSLCVCLPEKTKAFAATLTPEELAREVSEQEVRDRFDPAVIDPCAGEQIHAMYGDECPQRFKRSGLDVKHYCACMKDVVGAFSAAKTAEIAAAASDYLPLAASAEQHGYPVPPRPAVLEDYFQADQRCKAAKQPAAANKH
jgi:hypothetical protein